MLIRTRQMYLYCASVREIISLAKIDIPCIDAETNKRRKEYLIKQKYFVICIIYFIFALKVSK